MDIKYETLYKVTMDELNIARQERLEFKALLIESMERCRELEEKLKQLEDKEEKGSDTFES